MTARWGWILSAGLGCLWLPHCGDGDNGKAKTKQSDDAGDDTEKDGQTDTFPFETVFKDSVEDDANALFAPPRIVEVRLTLPADAWEQLQINARDEIYTPAEVEIDGASQGEVGLRFKGSYGTLYNCFEDDVLICDKLSMKIKFSEYDKEKRYKGLKRLNLHSMVYDISLMEEYFAFKIFRDAGIPTARSGFANVWVNDTLLGLYGLVEQLDGRFTDSRFVEGDGNLYKEVQLTTSDTALDEALRTNEEAPDHTVFKAFSEAMLDADDGALRETTAQWMNLSYLMRLMAVNDAIANSDSLTIFFCGEWGCFNHNFFIYQEETLPRLWVVPWDMGGAFDLDNWLGAREWDDLSRDCDEWYETQNAAASLRPSCGDPLMKALALYKAETDTYAEALAFVLDAVFVPEKLRAEIAALADVLEPAVDADPDRDVAQWMNGVRGFRNDLTSAHDRASDILFDETASK